MLPTRQDFRLQASHFDLSDGHNLIRIICGLFLFPHVAGKFAAGSLAAGAVGFFGAAGFHPPELWVALAASVELVCGVALVLGVCTRWAALGVTGVMAVAVFALHGVKGFGWTWNTGGYEFPVFWGLTVLGIALSEFRRVSRTQAASRPVRMRQSA